MSSLMEILRAGAPAIPDIDNIDRNNTDQYDDPDQHDEDQDDRNHYRGTWLTDMTDRANDYAIRANRQADDADDICRSVTSAMTADDMHGAMLRVAGMYGEAAMLSSLAAYWYRYATQSSGDELSSRTNAELSTVMATLTEYRVRLASETLEDIMASSTASGYDRQYMPVSIRELDRLSSLARQDAEQALTMYRERWSQRR